jgi:hypothetical protein
MQRCGDSSLVQMPTEKPTPVEHTCRQAPNEFILDFFLPEWWRS